MEEIIKVFGIPGIGFAFLYFVLNKNFDSQGKLVEKIDKLADNIHELVVANAQKNVNLTNTADEIKNQYCDISTAQETLKQIVDEINIKTNMCPRRSDVK